MHNTGHVQTQQRDHRNLVLEATHMGVCSTELIRSDHNILDSHPLRSVVVLGCRQCPQGYSATSAGRHGAETLPVIARKVNEYQPAATFGTSQI